MLTFELPFSTDRTAKTLESRVSTRPLETCKAAPNKKHLDRFKFCVFGKGALKSNGASDRSAFWEPICQAEHHKLLIDVGCVWCFSIAKFGGGPAELSLCLFRKMSEL